MNVSSNRFFPGYTRPRVSTKFALAVSKERRAQALPNSLDESFFFYISKEGYRYMRKSTICKSDADVLSGELEIIEGNGAPETRLGF